MRSMVCSVSCTKAKIVQVRREGWYTRCERVSDKDGAKAIATGTEAAPLNMHIQPHSSTDCQPHGIHGVTLEDVCIVLVQKGYHWHIGRWGIPLTTQMYLYSRPFNAERSDLFRLLLTRLI